MAAYLTVSAFRGLTVAPGEYVDFVETAYPGWVLTQLDHISRWLDSQLRKRYAVPFNPIPEQIELWVSRIMTWRLYMKRGVNPTDEQSAQIKEDHDAALKEIQQAADAKDGLWDLPLNDAQDGSAIAKGMPLGYSEVSPYSWSGLQRLAAETEDDGGEQ